MSDSIYFPNPKRGCGTKVPGGFYAETEMSRGGTLNLWTWLLGDGLEGGINCLLNIPPRRAVYGNLAASLTIGEFVGADVPMDGIDQFFLGNVYQSLQERTAVTALFDHVGTKYYSPWSFAQETMAYGPSRRIPPALAEELAKKVPLPVVFTHSHVPIFRDEAERAEAIVIAEELMGILAEEADTAATWINPEWGIYARNHDGHDHYLVWVLGVIARLTPDFLGMVGDGNAWQDAKEFFDTINYAEQPFGVSWLTRVGYVPKEGDDVTAVSNTLNRKGIQIIDIAAPDPVPVLAQVQEQRRNPLTGRFIGGERKS